MNTKKILILFCAIMAFAVGCSDKGSAGDGLDEGGDSFGVSYRGDVHVVQQDETVFTKSDVEVVLMETDARLLDMQMLKVSFAASMPIELDITVKGISYVKIADSTVISGDNLVPIAMGGEFPKYTIKNLTGTEKDGVLEFSMMCGDFPLSYSGCKVTD